MFIETIDLVQPTTTALLYLPKNGALLHGSVGQADRVENNCIFTFVYIKTIDSI